MDMAKSKVVTQSHRTVKSAPSRAQRLFRYLESLCRRQTRSLSDPAPGSYFQAYRERHENSGSVPSHSQLEKPRPGPPDFSPPDFRPFEIDLQSLTALDDSEGLSNPLDADVRQAGHAELESQKISDLRSYQLGQLNENRMEKDTKAVSPVRLANLEKKFKLESRGNECPESSRKDSLLTNLYCLQPRISALAEKVTLWLSELEEDIVLRDQNHNPKRASDNIERESEEHGKKSHDLSMLVHLIHLNDKIKSLVISLDDPEAEPQLAFYANAWLVVHQMNDLENTTMELLSDMEKRGFWDGKLNLGIQSTARPSYRIRADLFKISEEVSPRCERLISRLERLAVEAKMLRPPSVKIVVCPCCGQETPEMRASS